MQMKLRNRLMIVMTAAALTYAGAAVADPEVIADDLDEAAEEIREEQLEGWSGKQLNDPLPPESMKMAPRGAVPSPRGNPQGMGNEQDFTKTPGDDDPSDGIDEPGRDPIPGLPRPAP
jgi:hypothetical protein